MAKITQYPAKTVPSNNDEFVLHDTAAGSTKKMTRGDLIGGAPLPADTVDGQAIANGAVTTAKIDFGTFTPTTSNGWRVSADGRIATKTISQGGFLPFGVFGGSNWTQMKPIGSLPSGFTLANCNIQLTPYSDGDKAAIIRGISGSNIVYANLANTSVGDSSTTCKTDIMLIKTN